MPPSFDSAAACVLSRAPQQEIICTWGGKRTYQRMHAACGVPFTVQPARQSQGDLMTNHRSVACVAHRTARRLLTACLSLAAACCFTWFVALDALAQESPADKTPLVLPGTAPLKAEGDLASAMVDGIDRFLLEETKAAAERRADLWKRDYTSHESYERSIEPQRERFKQIIGVVDEREVVEELELITTTQRPSLVARANDYQVHRVRWPVLPGVTAEGYLLTPALHASLADVVAIPDADQTPEMLIGLVECGEHVQFARRLAENRCRVLVPTVISRDITYSATWVGRATNQPHREFVYRPAFEMGRHIIGYEVQKVLAAVDWFRRPNVPRQGSVGVIGYGEGGLIALYAAAADPRIDACCVSGYFRSRQGLWKEPIYRNVFSLLEQFGDAEIASLVAPRALVVEACKHPEVAGPPLPRDNRRGAAPGAIDTPPEAEVRAEFQQALELVKPLQPRPAFTYVASGEDGRGPHGTEKALAAFVTAMIPDWELEPSIGPPRTVPAAVDAEYQKDRQRRQLLQLLEHTQSLLRDSEAVRDQRHKNIDLSSLDKYQQSIEPYREMFYRDVIGRFDRPLLPANSRTRQVFDEPKYRGYEVLLDVFPDVQAYGILLVPKDIKPGEKRPVVVCQHGLEGRPQDVADPSVNHRAYEQYGCRLAERGFVVYAPQNPYLFGDRFRSLQRKANPLGKSLFSVIVPQHEQTTAWLASLPFVDGERIAFYGLSYGGKTAMRVPALVDRYCLSICSADFNEWIWKNASLRSRYSYVGTGEYEIFEFNLGHTFNYAEMAALICPRPFMVERGHDDGVAPDSQVAYEYAKVRLRYDKLGIGDRTEIEFFNGPHKINGVGTFRFLHRHLNWPEPEPTMPAGQ